VTNLIIRHSHVKAARQTSWLASWLAALIKIALQIEPILHRFFSRVPHNLDGLKAAA
jgi:hypothetical protein